MTLVATDVRWRREASPRSPPPHAGSYGKAALKAPQSKRFVKFEDRSRSPKTSKPVELLRQLEIFFGQATRVVRGQRERGFVPADVDVRMMPRLLGDGRDLPDEADGSGKILELVRARDRRVFLPPILHGRERGFDLCR